MEIDPIAQFLHNIGGRYKLTQLTEKCIIYRVFLLDNHEFQQATY